LLDGSLCLLGGGHDDCRRNNHYHSLGLIGIIKRRLLNVFEVFLQ
jgi:hypothetical protein